MTTETRERLGLDDHRSPWWGEHRSRYHFAVPYVGGRTVLDIACGSGYGGLILRQGGARLVLGIDLSAEGLALARSQRRDGFVLAQADGTRLPLADASVDVVTSFETVEHVHDPGRFIAELRRVLRPDGTLVLSTPNALVTRPVHGVPRNPFHIEEFEPAQLAEMLLTSFGQVRQLAQLTHPRFHVSPYWQLPEHVPSSGIDPVRTLIWKAGARLPYTVRETLWRSFARRPFHPGEHDFVFVEEGLDRAHVQVAVCQP